jgi:hypothetical protein
MSPLTLISSFMLPLSLAQSLQIGGTRAAGRPRWVTTIPSGADYRESISTVA